MREESTKEESEDEEEVEAEAEQRMSPPARNEEDDAEVHDPTAAASDAARPAPPPGVQALPAHQATWSRTRARHGRTREGHGRRAMGSPPLSGSNCGHRMPHPPRAYCRGTGTHQKWVAQSDPTWAEREFHPEAQPPLVVPTAGRRKTEPGRTITVYPIQKTALVFRNGYVSIMDYDIDMEAPPTPYREKTSILSPGHPPTRRQTTPSSGPPTGDATRVFKLWLSPVAVALTAAARHPRRQGGAPIQQAQAKGQGKDKGKDKDQGKRAGLYSAQKRSAPGFFRAVELELCRDPRLLQ